MPPIMQEEDMMQGPSPPHAIRTKRQSPNTIKTNTSVVSSQHPYPEYPIVIPPEKLTKALALYNAFKLEEHLAGHNAHRGAYLIPSVSGSSRDSNHSLSPSLEEVSRQTDYGSVVSFSQSPQKVKPELTTFDGKVVKARQRKRLSPMARAKAALIRYLGSCQPCRNRRMPCPLGHHDIERLETLRWTSELARAETEFEDSVPLDVHSDIMNRHNSQPDVLLGLGQNPELLQDINNSSRDDIELPPATKIHAPPGAKFGHQSHHPIESTSIPGQPFLRVETSVPSPHNSTSSETSSNHVEKHFAQMGLDTVDNSKHETPSVTESLRTESGFNAGSSSNNLATEIAAAVEASYEAAYGPGPALPSLLSKLQSIFNDGTFESSESIFKLQDTTCNDGASQHVGASKEAPACGDQNYNTSGSPTTFLGTGSRPGNDLLDRRTKGSSRVKTAKSNAKPSVRVLRRLRCHFNARHPRKYCVTRSTGDKYHVCSKSGYLTIAHLKQHNKSTHTVSRCTRCGGLFGSSEKMGEHSRAYPACDPVLPDQWPGIDQAENINETIQERITINLTARGYQQLPQTTKDALNIWVSANITEYVSDSPTPQDLLELKNWYLIWLALFPGIVVPTHPFCDGPSISSAEDGRFLEVFQTIVQEKIAARQMTAISSSLLNEILERLRETQIIVGTMSQAAHISTLGAEGEGNPASNSSEDIPATPPASTDYLSSELAQRSTKRPRNDQEVRSSPNRSFQSNQQETASLKTDNFAQQAEAGPKSAPTFRQDMNFSGPTLARAEYFTPGPRLGMHFNNQWLADPWSSNMPRFAGHQQQQSSVPSYQELDLPGTTGYMGTEFGILSSPSLDVNLNSFDQEWFESLEFPNLETGNQAQSSSYDQMSETR